MTTKNICQNPKCRHEGYTHDERGCMIQNYIENEEPCPCKKFKPQSPQKATSLMEDSPKGYSSGDTQNQDDGMELCSNCNREKFMHQIVEFYDMNDCSGFKSQSQESSNLVATPTAAETSGSVGSNPAPDTLRGKDALILKEVLKETLIKARVGEPEEAFDYAIREAIARTHAKCEKEIRFLKGRCFNWKIKYDKLRAECEKETKRVEGELDSIKEISNERYNKLEKQRAEFLEFLRFISGFHTKEYINEQIEQKIQELSKEVRG